MTNISIGQKAEAKAEKYLRKNGFKLEQRNYRCKCGEIDLIMSNRETIIFVEVRQRTDYGFGSASESITASKRSKLSKTASHYLMTHPEACHKPCRFDVVAIDKSGSSTHIDWIPNAFEVDY